MVYLVVTLLTAGVIGAVYWLWRRGNLAQADADQAMEALNRVANHLETVYVQQKARAKDIRSRLEADLATKERINAAERLRTAIKKYGK